MAPRPFRIYNTATRSVSEFQPQEPGKIGMYVCGVTVYDRSHVGHARAMVVFDTITRYLRHRGWEVNYVRNFTDVDDKIIAAAKQSDEDPLALSQHFIELFREDAEALGLVAPDAEPKVSEHIDVIIEMIQKLVERGHAYTHDGGVWYSVPSFRAYGQLSGQKVDELRSEDPGDKQHSADFALWKAAKPGEPSWESPWGPGRPGWHIECSAMSTHHLGPTLDIHGGGLDLVFPHHENEIAQSEGATGQPYARYWLHNGLLTEASGRKMGKSFGNVYDIIEALQLFPAEALRLYYLQSHYRSPIPWDKETSLEEALSMLARLYEAREVAEVMMGEEPAEAVAEALGRDAQEVLALGRAFSERFYAAMDDDFNTSKALGHLFELARAVNRFSNHKKARKRGAPVVAPALSSFSLVAETIGLMTMDTEDYQAEVRAKRLPTLGLTEAEVQQLLDDRVAARAQRDWARADAIRDELEAKGIAVMDTAQGTDWRVRL